MGYFILIVLGLVALCQAVSQTEGERENGNDRREKTKHTKKKKKKKKTPIQPPTAPTASTLGPNPYYYPNYKDGPALKVIQHHLTTRPPPAIC